MDYLFALQTVREAAPDFINFFFVIVSEYLVILSFIIPAFIYWNFDKSAGSTILLGYCVSFDLNQTIKNIACVYRPWILDSRLHIDSHAVKSATGYSFPSGHVTTASSIYGGISVWQKKRTGIVVAMSFIILLTAFARNWLGAHTLQDVVAGVVFVALWLILVNLAKYWLQKNPSRDTVLCFGGIILAVVILVFLSFKSYPLDYYSDGAVIADPYKMKTDCFTGFGCLAGGLLGWWIQRHFLNFSVDVSKKAKYVRSISGLIITFGLYFSLGALFSFTGEHFCHLIKYFILFVYMMYLHPLLFTKILERNK